MERPGSGEDRCYSPGWTKFAAFASDPENQAAVGSLGLLAKDLTTVAISFMGRNT
ncbi:hypothetical protein SJI19_22125, partial [Acerihabitans sp. TG2]|nr:hypothetical protein [Acerihabitans sp. TG2]